MGGEETKLREELAAMTKKATDLEVVIMMMMMGMMIMIGMLIMMIR